MVNPDGDFSADCRTPESQRFFGRSDDRDSLPDAGGDLRFFDRRHLHERCGAFALAAFNSGRFIGCGSVCRDDLSHPGVSLAGLDLSDAGDRDDDQLRLSQLWLDLALVRRGHRYRRADHHHVCGV